MRSLAKWKQKKEEERRSLKLQDATESGGVQGAEIGAEQEDNDVRKKVFVHCRPRFVDKVTRI